MPKKKPSYITCPHCGATIKSTAKACPHCGSDEQTGWSESTYLDGIDLPGEVDYDDLAQREFGTAPSRQSWWRSWKVLLAAALAALFIYGYLRVFL